MRLKTPPGVPLATARRRLRDQGHPGLIPLTSNDTHNAATSLLRTATPTTGNPVNTKGAWTQLVASTAVDIHTLRVRQTAFALVFEGLYDIGVGGAGSEQVIVPNVPFGASFGTAHVFPVFIPRGSRIAVRDQHAVSAGSATWPFELLYWTARRGRLNPRHVVAMGVNTATSRGVSMPALGVANTKSAWTEITASVPEPLSVVWLGCQANGDLAFSTDQGATIDLAVGAAGNEQIIVADGHLLDNNNTVWIQNAGMTGQGYGVAIPAGARLSARWQCGVTVDALDLTVHGLPA